MRVHDLKATPPWEWPADAGNRLLATLLDEDAPEAERRLAAELAGELVVMSDELAAALINLLEDARQPEQVRARAAISLGPVLDDLETEGFDDGEDPPVSEATFRRIQASLRRVHGDAAAPKEVRRRALEAAVRAPQPWQRDAIRAAFASGDDAWRLTAVFCMRFVKGFDEQILEALKSTDADIVYEAVAAAGNWEIEAAWPHVSRLLASGSTDKPLLLAAIEAAATIRPHDAEEILGDLLESDDEDIAGAVEEALVMARGLSGDITLDDDDDEDG